MKINMMKSVHKFQIVCERTKF